MIATRARMGDLRLEGEEWPMRIPALPPQRPVPAGMHGRFGLLRLGEDLFAWERFAFDPVPDLPIPSGPGGSESASLRDRLLSDPGDDGFTCRAMAPGEFPWPGWLPSGIGTLIDFMGIDSLVGGRNRHFRDADARAVALHFLGFPRCGFQRFGVTGLAAPGPHPGGEGVEWDLIESPGGGGRSRSHAGRLLAQGGAANAWFADTETGARIDARSDYSQTIWTPLVGLDANRSLLLHILPRREISLLDALAAIAARLGIRARGTRVTLARTPDGRAGEVSRITGRVLNPDPVTGWRTLEDARVSAVEKEFALAPGERMLALGTAFPRREPEWEALSGGRMYEARGHYHASLASPEGAADGDRPKTFHLRDARLGPGCEAYAELIPAGAAYRIHPVSLRGGVPYALATGKPLSAEAG